MNREFTRRAGTNLIERPAVGSRQDDTRIDKKCAGGGPDLRPQEARLRVGLLEEQKKNHRKTDEFFHGCTHFTDIAVCLNGAICNELYCSVRFL